MPKIIHITETFATGVYLYIKDLSNFFDDFDDFETVILYSGNRLETEKSRFKKDFSEKVNFEEISMKKEISPLSDLNSIRQLYLALKKHKPDIIHCHSSKGGVLGRLAALFYLKAKVFYTPHGYSFLREDISNNKKKIFYSIEKLASLLLPGTTVACGDTEFEYAKKIGKSKLVRNGVNIPEISQYLKEKKEKETFIIGTIGRVSFQKNPKLFNDIASLLPDIKFIWVGNGKKELEKIFTSKNIELTGWKTREEVLKIANTFDIYIQTSLWEGLPITILEAMALGKVVIATNVIGNKDAVVNGETGYLCNTAFEFKEKILALLEDHEKHSKMKALSLKRVKANFNKHINFKQLKKTYLSE